MNTARHHSRPTQHVRPVLWPHSAAQIAHARRRERRPPTTARAVPKKAMADRDVFIPLGEHCWIDDTDYHAAAAAAKHVAGFWPGV